MAMGVGGGGHGPSEVTCRIGGDRPGCDFMITTLGERRAGDRHQHRVRLMLAVLGGLADVVVGDRPVNVAGRINWPPREMYHILDAPIFSGSGLEPDKTGKHRWLGV